MNFIGKFNIPVQAKAEPETFDPAEHRRATWRKCYHKNRDRILAEKRKLTEERRAAKLAEKMSRNPAEIEAEARRQRQLEYHREYQREWQRRKKQAALETA